MRQPDVDLVAFDLGGTILQDRGDVAAAFRQALAEHALEVAPHEIDVLRGRSKRDAIRRLLLAAGVRVAPRDVELRVQSIHAAFEALLLERLAATEAGAVPGAIDTLQWLRRRGIKIAVMTGFERRLATGLLGRLGSGADVIDAMACADDVAVGRPAPYLIFKAMELTRAVRVSHVMAVGDTEADLLAAANAGVGHAVAVLSGAHSRARLERRPHAAMLDSVASLPDLWTQG